MVERGFACLQASRRLRTRWARRVDPHLGLLELAWVRVSTGSLWPAVLLHNAINSSAVAMVALTQ